MRARTFTIALAAALTGPVASAQQPPLQNLLPVPLAPPTAPKARQQATPPAPPALPGKGKVELAAVAQDERCEKVFEPTSPLTMAADVISGWATAAMQQQQQGGRKPVEQEMRARFKAMSRTQTWLPIEIEEMLGDTMLEKKSLVNEAETQTGRNAPKYQRTRALFERIVGALPPDTAYRFRLHFSRDTSLNLEALPGGHVVVNTAALDAKQELVAALFAHEIAHVTKRHYTREIQGYIADTVTVTEVVSALASGKPDKQRAAAWFAGVHYLDKLFSKFYEDQELEADACIPRLLKAAGVEYEPAMLAFEEWALDRRTAANQGRAFFERRHPHSEKRVTVLKSSGRHWSTREARMAEAGEGGKRLSAPADNADATRSSLAPDPAPAAGERSDAGRASAPAPAAAKAEGAAEPKSGSIFDRARRSLRKLADDAGKAPAQQDDPNTRGN
ncbi:MAG: hypothetical protein BroJett031_23660 [Betaproteobacteria bacterium]|nr:MAG: hypothetical protein BroJett031_23660 [Betaproteobacteria bacterium]